MTASPATTFAAPPAHRAECSRIAGFLGSGMLDWPGKVTATVFLGGCPLRCPYCHNPGLLGEVKRPIEVSAVLEHVRAKRGWLDGVVITGGEPTADPGLPALIRELKAEGLGIKLDTNGTAPLVLERLLAEGCVDFVALDVKAAPERYDAATGRTGVWTQVRNTISLIMESGVDHEFRTTCYPLAVDLSDLPRIAALLSGGRRYAVQQFRPQGTLDPAATTVRPHEPAALRRTAERCSVYLPTVVRGA